MYNYYFQFAKLVLRIESTVPVVISAATKPFAAEQTQWNYQICVSTAVDRQFEINGCGSLRAEGNTFYLCLDANTYETVSVMQILSYLPLGQMLFDHDMAVLHASYVLHQGEAILFSGDSGVGKSTQAALWKDQLGSKIINGDRTLIYIDGGVVYASGWFQSGTSGICNGGVAPIKAIVFLEQWNKNDVSLLKGLDAFKRMICQCSYETGNLQQVQKVTEIVAQVLNEVPAYHYRCNKEPDAAEYLKTYLYG